VLVGLALRPRSQPRVSSAGFRPQVVQANSRAVQARGQEVVDREVDAGRVQLLEDGADATDGFAVGFIDAGQLDERRLECLKRGRSAGPPRPPLREVPAELVGRV
jgi:hypothetical protein